MRQPYDLLLDEQVIIIWQAGDHNSFDEQVIHIHPLIFIIPDSDGLITLLMNDLIVYRRFRGYFNVVFSFFTAKVKQKVSETISGICFQSSYCIDCTLQM